MQNPPPLPKIVIKPHARAKHLKLSVSHRGIRLTVPYGCSQRDIDQFLQKSQAWLLQTWQKYQQYTVSNSPNSQQNNIHSSDNIIQNQFQNEQQQLPTVLHLAFSNQVIQIEYDKNIKLSQFDPTQPKLIINPHHAEKLLTHFIIQQAKLVLPYQVRCYAEQQHLTVNKIRIATPHTRWGSCSSKQDIMLHAGLLLMPQAQAEYVIWHELAHTKHMHHQAEFWQFLQQIYPPSVEFKKQARQFQLPHWWKVK
ncbi:MULTISPECIES: YgjP-like metallopeptidase domain-containing protein [unclassified Acinetobacter]|uniref:YgjP-like metallopeptidase domain-containing protein n=1 Tax=unclassified Acinetobacter TaxID=196816 RepID=UPI0035B9B645